MHRTQILLEDSQYEALKTESVRTGKSIGELVRIAVAEKYEVKDRAAYEERMLKAIRESAGAAHRDDFDGLSGEEYVERIRRPGPDRRLKEQGW